MLCIKVVFGCGFSFVLDSCLVSYLLSDCFVSDDLVLMNCSLHTLFYTRSYVFVLVLVFCVIILNLVRVLSSFLPPSPLYLNLYLPLYAFLKCTGLALARGPHSQRASEPRVPPVHRAESRRSPDTCFPRPCVFVSCSCGLISLPIFPSPSPASSFGPVRRFLGSRYECVMNYSALLFLNLSAEVFQAFEEGV